MFWMKVHTHLLKMQQEVQIATLDSMVDFGTIFDVAKNELIEPIEHFWELHCVPAQAIFI